MIIQHTSLTNPAVFPGERASSPVAPTTPAPAAPVTAPASPAKRPLSAEELKNVVETLNKAMQQANQSLEFSVDSDTKKVVVKMVDTSTGQLIRQFPSDATLAISREIEQIQQGLLLKQKA